jgi:hypothetical protein
MKKVRSNARWNGLSAKQRATLEVWLFEDGVGYEEALRRACMELGFQGSVSSLKRFYVRRSQERVLERLVETQEDAEAIEAAPATVGLFRSAAMKLMGQLLLRQVREMPGEVKEWSALAKLMLWHEDIELRRQLKTEENALRRENLAFAKERFQFNVVRQAEKALPQLQELARARQDPKLEEYEENKRINAIKRAIFGDEVLPGSMDPENAEEEEAMRLAPEAAEREPQRAQQEQDAAAQRRREEYYQEWLTQRRAQMAGEEQVVEEGKPGEEASAEETASPAAPEPVTPEAERAGGKRGGERPKGRPTCITYQEWARGQAYAPAAKAQGPSSKAQ